MHLLLTSITLALVFLCVLVLRLRWPHLTRQAHWRILAIAAIPLALYGLSLLTGYTLSTLRLQGCLYWSALSAYVACVVLFSALRPRLLTSIAAVILLLPIFSSSVFIPLTDIFTSYPATVVPLDNRLYTVRQAFASESPGYTGVDLTIYSTPRLLPFLRRRHQGARFLNLQCNAAASHALLQPDGHTVRMLCPPWPAEHGLGGTDLLVQLY